MSVIEAAMRANEFFLCVFLMAIVATVKINDLLVLAGVAAS